MMISIRFALVLLLSLNFFSTTAHKQLAADETSIDSKEWKIDSQEQWQASSLQNSNLCLLYTSPSPRDRQKSRMPSSA